MEGAAMRQEYRMREIWLGAMLPHFKKAPSIDEFATGGKHKDRASLVACLSQWDKIDAALAANKNRAA